MLAEAEVQEAAPALRVEMVEEEEQRDGGARAAPAPPLDVAWARAAEAPAQPE